MQISSGETHEMIDKNETKQPKEYVIEAFKSGDRKKITACLNSYFKSRNYYKKRYQTDIISEARKVFD